jgi:hypothetical protein
MVAFMYLTKAAAVYPSILACAGNIKKDLRARGKLSVAGFCCGGYTSTVLCVELAVDGRSARLIETQFGAYPSKLDLQKVVPEAVMKWKVYYFFW